MTIQKGELPLSPYAPRTTHTLRLAGATIQAVDQLGVATCDEIEKAAEELERSAAEIAHKLRELAASIRDQTKIASAQVAGFCDKANGVLEGLSELQQKLNLNNSSGPSDVAEEALPLLIGKGPAQD